MWNSWNVHKTTVHSVYHPKELLNNYPSSTLTRHAVLTNCLHVYWKRYLNLLLDGLLLFFSNHLISTRSLQIGPRPLSVLFIRKTINLFPKITDQISLTSICCKVMEHVVLSHMAKHLSKNNIIIDKQHGFRQRFSCETQLITTIHDWAKSINVCHQTDAILLDFSKAFDSATAEIGL